MATNQKRGSSRLTIALEQKGIIEADFVRLLSHPGWVDEVVAILERPAFSLPDEIDPASAKRLIEALFSERYNSQQSLYPVSGLKTGIHSDDASWLAEREQLIELLSSLTYSQQRIIILLHGFGGSAPMLSGAVGSELMVPRDRLDRFISTAELVMRRTAREMIAAKKIGKESDLAPTG